LFASRYTRGVPFCPTSLLFVRSHSVRRLCVGSFQGLEQRRRLDEPLHHCANQTGQRPSSFQQLSIQYRSEPADLCDTPSWLRTTIRFSGIPRTAKGRSDPNKTIKVEEKLSSRRHIPAVKDFSPYHTTQRQHVSHDAVVAQHHRALPAHVGCS
jgi:hypothetical protein